MGKIMARRSRPYRRYDAQRQKLIARPLLSRYNQVWSTDYAEKEKNARNLRIKAFQNNQDDVRFLSFVLLTRKTA